MKRCSQPDARPAPSQQANGRTPKLGRSRAVAPRPRAGGAIRLRLTVGDGFDRDRAGDALYEVTARTALPELSVEEGRESFFAALPLPEVEYQGGPVLDAPRIIGVFFAGDPLQELTVSFLESYRPAARRVVLHRSYPSFPSQGRARIFHSKEIAEERGLLAGRTLTISHELIEAATVPYPSSCQGMCLSLRHAEHHGSRTMPSPAR